MFIDSPLALPFRPLLDILMSSRTLLDLFERLEGVFAAALSVDVSEMPSPAWSAGADARPIRHMS